MSASRLTVHFADAPRPDGTLLFGAEVYRSWERERFALERSSRILLLISARGD